VDAAGCVADDGVGANALAGLLRVSLGQVGVPYLVLAQVRALRGRVRTENGMKQISVTLLLHAMLQNA